MNTISVSVVESMSLGTRENVFPVAVFFIRAVRLDLGGVNPSYADGG